MRIRIMCLVAASWLGSTVQAQTGGAVPEFDAASVKANHSETDKAGMQMSKGFLAISNVPLAKIVGTAFGIAPEREGYLLAGPGWMARERYDVTAKFSVAAADQVRLMLQTLLKERFGMRFHREMREVPAYALVVAKGGLKARAAVEGSAAGFRRGPGHLESQASTMALLADKISQQSDRPVVDMTSVPGAWEFSLDWTPDELQNEVRAGASLFTAMEQQLGLKLEAHKMPMEVVVIDYIDKIPRDN